MMIGMTCLIVIIIWQLWTHCLSYQHPCLECPGTRDVSHGISASAEHEYWKVEALHKVNAISMSLHAKIEASKSITRQAVSTTLKYNGFRSVIFHNTFDDWLEDSFVGSIVNAVAKRKVDRVMLSLANANVAKLTSTRKVFAILVERHCHDPISGVESFFDTITMMNVDVNIEHTLPEAEQLEDP